MLPSKDGIFLLLKLKASLQCVALSFVILLTTRCTNAGLSICDKTYQSSYNLFEKVDQMVLRKRLILNSFDLHLYCDSTFTYTNTCTGKCWEGVYSFSIDQDSIVVSSFSQSSLFPKTYAIKNNRLIGLSEWNGNTYVEILGPVISK